MEISDPSCLDGDGNFMPEVYLIKCFFPDTDRQTYEMGNSQIFPANTQKPQLDECHGDPISLAIGAVAHRSESLTESSGKVHFCFSSIQRPDFLVVEILAASRNNSPFAFAEAKDTPPRTSYIGPGCADSSSDVTNGMSVQRTFMSFARESEVISQNREWEFHIFLPKKGTCQQIYPWIRRFDRHVHFSPRRTDERSYPEDKEPGLKCVHFNTIDSDVISEDYLAVLSGIDRGSLIDKCADLNSITVSFTRCKALLLIFSSMIRIPIFRPCTCQIWASTRKIAMEGYRSMNTSNRR